MTHDEALELLGDLQSAFRRELPDETEAMYARVLMDRSFEECRDGLRTLIETEERFPPIAVVLRYLGRLSEGGVSESERQRGIRALADQVRHMAQQRNEPFEETLRGHAAMCQENAEVTGDEETWLERVRWCEELLRREVGNALSIGSERGTAHG